LALWSFIGFVHTISCRIPRLLFRHAPSASTAHFTSELRVPKCLLLKKAAEGQGGVGSVLKAVQAVRGEADSVHGIDRLVYCLEALQKVIAREHRRSAPGHGCWLPMNQLRQRC